MTDTQKVLKLFRENPNKELNHRIIVVDMGISEYTGRIRNARVELGCTCGEDKATCTAPEHIVNTRKGFYKFVTSMDVVKPRQEQIMVTLKELKQRRESLVEEYLEAKKRGDQMHMKIVEIRGKAIKNAIEQQERAELTKASLF